MCFCLCRSAPECSFTVTYSTKWFLTESLPIMLVLVILSALIIARLFQSAQRLILRRLPTGATSDVHLTDVCLGILITGLYYTYFVVVRTGLAPFNCRTRNGVSSMVADPTVLCNVPGGPHATIVPFAKVALVLYGLGIPVVRACLLYARRLL